jgi:hypothetical protein
MVPSERRGIVVTVLPTNIAQGETPIRVPRPAKQLMLTSWIRLAGADEERILAR